MLDASSEAEDGAGEADLLGSGLLWWERAVQVETSGDVTTVRASEHERERVWRDEEGSCSILMCGGEEPIKQESKAVWLLGPGSWRECTN